MRSLLVVSGIAALVGLSACTERPQEQGARDVGAPASAGTGSQFVTGGWKPGDAASWDEHIRSRAQYGQNEYSRSTSQ